MWADDEVVRVDADQVDLLGLPEAARRVLVDVGVPRSVEPLFEFRPLETITNTKGEVYCRFGTDEGTSLLINVGDGTVSAVSLEGLYPERFVNTDLETFFEFLREVTLARRQVARLHDHEAIERILEALQGSLVARDNLAFADPENWWSVVLEQLTHGLL